MRMTVVNKAADAASLVSQLGVDGAGKAHLLLQMQRLNPHVDFKRIEPGTVLLVPDQPGLKAGETSSVGGQAFDAFRDQVTGSMEAATRRVRQGHEALAAQRAEVNAVLKTAALKRLLEADPDLKPQLDAAAEVFKQDQQRAKDADATLKILQDGVLAELAVLAKRIA